MTPSKQEKKSFLLTVGQSTQSHCGTAEVGVGWGDVGVLQSPLTSAGDWKEMVGSLCILQ